MPSHASKNEAEGDFTCTDTLHTHTQNDGGRLQDVSTSEKMPAASRS